MKSSASSFSISSSSSSSSSGCISGILRRFLCAFGLSSCPSDRFSESNSKSSDFHQQSESKDVERLGARGCEPGVVARLMGLDSMPETDPGNTLFLQESITRSRSMNSVDCFCKESDRPKGRHRRAKSTLGLRQVSDFVELQDENFFILSFEHGGSKFRDLGLKEGKSEKIVGELKLQETGKSKNRRRTEKDLGEVKQRKTEELENLVMQRDMEDKENKKNALNAAEENRQPSKREKFGCDRLEDSVECYCPFNDEDLVDGKPRTRKKKKKEEETNCTLEYHEEQEYGSHEDSSPVSVLDFHRSLDVREPSESEISSRLEEPCLIRQLSPELEANEHNHEAVQGDERMKIGSEQFDGCNNDYSEMWLEISRITEAEMDESKWVRRGVTNYEEFEEINKVIVSRILDQLLEETIDQLASLTREVM